MTVLITGASTGIGYELARQFARHGHDVVLVARRQDLLDKLALLLRSTYNITAHTLAVDLAQPQAATTVRSYTNEQQLQIDTLVNNAGFGANGVFAEADATTQHSMIQVNITTLVELTRLYLPDMLKSGQGGILNVASTAAFAPGPYMAVYYASKAFVLSFSEALREEVVGTGVVISCLCPGATQTEFQGRAKMSSSKLFNSPFVMSAEAVARLGYEGYAAGKPRVVTGILNQLAILSTRLFPRGTIAKLTAKLQKPPSR